MEVANAWIFDIAASLYYDSRFRFVFPKLSINVRPASAAYWLSTG